MSNKKTLFSDLEGRNGVRYLKSTGKPFTGEAVKYYENGMVSRMKSYKNGKFHGESLSFYQNGEVREEENYVNGKKDGEFRVYFDNGELKYRSIYKDGKLVGKGKGFEV